MKEKREREDLTRLSVISRGYCNLFLIQRTHVLQEPRAMIGQQSASRGFMVDWMRLVVLNAEYFVALLFVRWKIYIFFCVLFVFACWCTGVYGGFRRAVDGVCKNPCYFIGS